MTKNRSLRKLLVLGVVMSAVVIASAWMNGGDIIEWRSDIALARQESRATHKPLILYFTATWCGPCQQMRQTTWADANVKSALSGYVPVKIDVDQHPDLAREYGVRSVPRIMLLNDAGHPVSILTGFTDHRGMIRWLDKSS